MRMTLSEYVNRGRLNELNLRIYYMSPSILTVMPVSIEDLKSEVWYEYTTLIDGVLLDEYVDLLLGIIDVILVPVEHDSTVNARIYYVFETKRGRAVLDVVLWSYYEYMIVNGVEVNNNDVFYDLLMPFLPKELANDLNDHISAKPFLRNSELR